MSTLAGGMVFSLAACGNKSTTETKKDTAESSQVTKKHSTKKSSKKSATLWFQKVVHQPTPQLMV